MKIYLLSIDRRRYFFYADEAEPSDEEGGDRPPGERPSGWRDRLVERWHRLRSAWHQSETGAARWSRRAWEWMHSWAHPDEAMLSRLRSARNIDLHHPASRDVGEVRRLWCSYLNHRWWRHLLWMGANGVVAPPGLLILWILPGPNLIGYWFAYRAIHHALILWGIRRLRGGRIPVEFHPMAELDRPIERDEDGRARHSAIESRAARLDEHVAWSEGEAPIGGAPPDGPARDVSGER